MRWKVLRINGEPIIKLELDLLNPQKSACVYGMPASCVGCKMNEVNGTGYLANDKGALWLPINARNFDQNWSKFENEC